MADVRLIKVSRELAGAVAEEQKRQAIDAAKKKAVAQHADYDTFKKMVSVAHLKPLHAPGTHGARGCSLPAWQLDPNSLGNPSHGASISTAAPPAPSQQGPGATAAEAQQRGPLPLTSQEFARDWRKHCPTPALKYRFLQECGPEGLARIFRVELDGLLLGQMLQAMQQQWQQGAAQVLAHHKQPPPQQQAGCILAPAQGRNEDTMQTQQQQQQQQEVQQAMSTVQTLEAVLVAQLLESLTGAGRFDLNVRLLDKPSRAAAAELCGQLQQALQQAAQQQQQQPVTASVSSSSDHSSAGACKGGSGSSGSAGDSRTAAAAARSSHGAVSDQQQQVEEAGSGQADGEDAAARRALSALQAVMLKLRVQ